MTLKSAQHGDGGGAGGGCSLAESTAFVSISAPQRCNFIWHKVTALTW